MITDNIRNAGLYGSLGERISKALDYIAANDFSVTEPGRYEIDGGNIYSVVMEYETKDEKDSSWEAHRKYVDIQYIAGGEEKIGYSDIKSLSVKKEYDPAADCMLLNGHGNFIICHPGTFVILYPDDAHMPGVSVQGAEKVRKVVVKILAE